MNTIKLLDKNTIDKIAAGEVVERPSSVVKELVENSIDAGAGAVSIEIKNGGKSLIRVTDNGSGIKADQVKKAFLRHSTSKISTADDLSFVSTLGFRGEALSSISAVSRLELCTKTKDDITGIIYRIEGGTEVSFEEAGLPDGTTVIVKDLFYNTPAREKFLRSDASEAGNITDMIEKIALSHPDVSVKFVSNGTVKLNTPGNGSVKDLIYALFGRDITSSLIEINSPDALMSVSGFIGKPEIARSSRAYENYFVNGRYVKDKTIAAAIEEAYKGLQMKGSFPFTDLYINIEPELVDVNVHPSKMEIRFSDPRAVFESLSSIISEALSLRENIPQVSLNRSQEAAAVIKAADVPEPFETKRLEEYKTTEHTPVINDDEAYMTGKDMSIQTDDETALPSGGGEAFDLPSDDRETDDPGVYVQTELSDDRFLSKEARSRHRIAGKVFDTYWIVEYEEQMYIIDQHAAHEKVLYERFVKQLKNGEHYSQSISPALIVSLNANEKQILEKHIDMIRQIGFEVEPFGGMEYAITAVPADLYTLNDRDLFLSFLDDIPAQKGSFSDFLCDRIATSACKAAVKGGNALSQAEADALIDDLLSLDDPYNCPHGRPTLIRMSRYELEKSFKRIV